MIKKLLILSFFYFNFICALSDFFPCVSELVSYVINDDLNGLEIYLESNPNINVNEQDEDGSTALHCACWSGFLDIVKFLVKKGADLEVKDVDGVRPINDAIKKKRFKVVSFLLKNGALITEEDFSLNDAIEFGHIRIIQYLLKNNAKVTKEHLCKASGKYKFASQHSNSLNIRTVILSILIHAYRKQYGCLYPTNYW